ncbi:MAG: metallopeptidase TldD-related protein [Acidobacteriota bacterium]|nr:metallopeptidase TldD-related protein [Acidobacteriota bacterium]
MTMDQFRLTPARINRILAAAMSRSGDFADIFCEQSRFNSLAMEEGILKSAAMDIEQGIGVRVVKGEKTGYAYSEVFDEAALLEAARSAASIADGNARPGTVEVKPYKRPDYYPVSDPAAERSLDSKIQLINIADAHARKVSKKVTKVQVTMVDHQAVILMADTRGRLVTDTRPMLRFTVTVVAEENGERQQARSGDGGRVGISYLTRERLESFAENAVREAELLLSARQAPAGMLPVILGPGDSGILLHEAIGHPLEADFNRKGSSAYTGRMNEMVADPQCTIIDDGTVPNERGSINFDDELNDSLKTVLIEEGRLTSYMYDEISARYFERESSGNGRRESYKFQPLPRMRTTYMLPGKYSHDEIIASTQRGVFCKTFKGGQVDISSGNFIFVPSEAWLVENGKLTSPIKNFSLIGNGPDVLSKVTMVADDFRMSAGIWTCGKGQQVPVGVGLPTIKISEMTVGGQKG